MWRSVSVPSTLTPPVAELSVTVMMSSPRGTDEPSRIDRDTIEGKAVVRQRRCELRRIKVGVVRRCILELSDNLQLAWIVDACHHGRNEIHHAVDTGDFHIVIGQAAHADAHIQPSVTIDQVVAALAHDDVAALTAKDDIAGAELTDVRDAASIHREKIARWQNGRPAAHRRKVKLEERIQEVL